MKQQLSDAVDDYLAQRTSNGYSKGTMRNERMVLKRFLSVSGNIWVHSITDRQVTRYFEDAGKTRQASSLKMDHTVLNQFFTWARQTRRLPIGDDPMAGRRRPRATDKERARLHVSEFPRLLAAAEKRDPRDRALIAVLLYTLVRASEAMDLRVGDVDLNSGYIHARIIKSKLEDRIPISVELDLELRNWLSFYAATSPRPLVPSDYLLPRRVSSFAARDEETGRILNHTMHLVPDKPLTTLGRRVKEVLEDIGFAVTDHEGKSNMEGAHTLRRSGARALFDQLIENGYDRALRLVQAMLHHKSVTMTEGYIGVTADRRTRDEVIRGQVMYPVDKSNVVDLGAVR